jgi:hypothetical protein
LAVWATARPPDAPRMAALAMRSLRMKVLLITPVYRRSP